MKWIILLKQMLKVGCFNYHLESIKLKPTNNLGVYMMLLEILKIVLNKNIIINNYIHILLIS